MVRNTRTSIALKNATPPAASQSEEETPPPPSVTTTAAGTQEAGLAEDAGGEESPTDRGSPRELMASGNEINLESAASLGACLSPSVLLQKLPVESGNRGGGGGAASGKKGPRKKAQPAPAARATRSKGKSSPVETDKEESNDGGMVELIEIVDDDSQGSKSVEIVSVNLEDELPCSLIVKDPGSTSKANPKKGECIVEAMDCDIDDTITIVDSKDELAEETSSTIYVVVDKADNVEIVQPSTSKQPEEQPPVIQEPEPPTRKSKRQVKVTNKYRDFVVDAPLPSSQVPYSDVKLARGNGGGRKSHVKETPEQSVSVCDDSSITELDSVVELGPESPPMTIRPPARTYSSGKKDKPAVRSRRKSIRPAVKEGGRGRKKGEWSQQLEEDETIELPGPDDKSDSTLTLHIDSSYFTDDEVIKYGSPSPTEFYGWPDEEFGGAMAGPSTSTLSTLTAFASDPCIFAELPAQLEESVSELEEPQIIKPVPKRRGRPPRSEQASPAISEEPVRPAGSTFIKRSYKTTNKTSPVATTPVTPAAPAETATPVKPLDLEPEQSEEPAESAIPTTIPEDVDTAVKIVEPSDIVVLQADEIINIPRRRRRIRGGRRPTPADGPPRRGRSRPDASLDQDDDSADESKSVEVVVPIEQAEEVPMKEEVIAEVIPEEPKSVPEEVQPEPEVVVAKPPEPEIVSIKKPDESVMASPKKSKLKTESKRDSSSESKSSKSSSKQRSRSTSIAERPKKEAETPKVPVELPPKSPEDVIILDSKEIILPEATSVEPIVEPPPTAAKEEKKPEKRDEPKTPKKSHKESRDRDKSHKKSKESRERDRDRSSSSKDSSRRDRDHSKSSRDRERDKERDKKRSSELGGSSSSSGKRDKERSESRKSMPEAAEKKAVEKKPAAAVVLPPEPEKKEKPATPIPEKPKVPEKPKKCFDMELQALEPIKKHRSGDDVKKSKDKEKHKEAKKKAAAAAAVAGEKKDVKQSKEVKPEKVRSTDTSPVPSKPSSSRKSIPKEAVESKEPSTQQRKRRKSIAGALVTEEKPKEESKVREKEVAAPLEPKEPPVEMKDDKPAESEVKTEIKVEQEQPDAPRIATKASRKMYQNEEEIQIVTSSIESVSSETTVTVKSEVKVEDAQVQQIAEEFDSSVQISGPRPEVALKAFEHISLAEVEPKVEEEATVQTISPPSQELCNEDSNSNNSSTMDSLKEQKQVDLDDSSIRRSSRIKTISSQKQRTSGHGLVKDRDRFLKKTTISIGIESKVLKDALTGNFNVVSTADGEGECGDVNVTNIELSDEYLRDMEEKLSRFETIKENLYHCDKVISKEAKKMQCDCFLTSEEKDRGELGCGEDCLNKLLMIECGSRCVVGERCTNKRFQKLEYANCQVFRTEKKGFGIQASTEIAPGEFIMEYVGEVLNSEQFDERAELYSKEKNKHYYFMALRSDAIIDATTKGNISRFINHSCSPNAETQKWTVNGELRIGFFSTKYILPGEEITFDYQFQRYGRKAQKCYCEADNCTGWIGGDPGSDGESEYEEEEVEESEEEAEVVTPAVSVGVPEEPAKVDVEDVAVIKEDEEVKKPAVEGELEKPTATVETPADKVVKPKPKKVRKRIERPIKRRLQIHEDPDLEKEINNLLKTGLKNQAQTLKLCRLMVRAKDIKSRSRLLTLLQSGELPCRRLFLDYHGLRLLYGWICESTESIEDLKFRIQILDTLDRLPIPNKTMLKDSKILQTIEKWAKIEKLKEKEKPDKPVEKEKETSSTSSPSDSNGGGSDSNTSSDKKQEVVGSAEVLKNMPELLKLADLGKLKEIISSTCSEKEGGEKEKSSTEVIPTAVSLMDSIAIPEPEDENAPEEKRLGTQIRILCCKLLISWINLKEVFRIPKKERIEQMKEHEREADLRYKALGLGDEEDASQRQHSSSRFMDRSVDRARELKRRKSMDDRELLNFHKRNRSLSTAIAMPKMDNLSKQQRRHLFEMKVAHEEAERRNKELWMQHENNCMKFGLNPHMTAPQDVPAKMNPATGEYFSADDRLLPTPPSHVYFKVLPPPMPTNPEDYELPPMDLPPLWKFAIDERGRLYYYHVKLRVPQWEPPKKTNPNRAGQGLRDEDISMSSDSSTTDTEDSEEEYLNIQLEALLKKKKKQQSCFNLDDVLAKPDDMNDDLSKTIKNLESGDSSPQASSSGEKLLSESLEKTAEELMQHRKRKHSNKLVQERVISPRTEEDKLYGQMEMKRYKETKEKLRRRKEEAKRLRARSMLDKSLSDSPFSSSFASSSSSKDSTSVTDVDDDLIAVSHKIVDDKCIVDELDVLTKKKKISPYEEWQKVKQRLGKKRAAKLAEAAGGEGGSSSFRSSPSSVGSSSSSKIGKRKKLDLNSEEARKIKEKFRGEIAGVIVQHLGAYRKETCQSGRITNTEDFKHLARKLTHFVLLKELKHCDNTINELTVSDSVRTKAREFIKKYMAKHGSVYVRGENEPDYANINL